MMPVVPSKTIVGNNVLAKASHVTNDEVRIYGSLWKLKKLNGVVITSENEFLTAAHAMLLSSPRNGVFLVVQL